MAAIPDQRPDAAAFVGLFSMLASLVSWSFSLIFSGLLAREVAHRVRGADYRAIGAAAYLGVGSVWALGLSSSAALIMAAPASLPGCDRADQRRHPAQPDARPVAEHASSPRALIVVSMAICYYSAPADAEARGHGGDGRHLSAAPRRTSARGRRPASGSSTARS